jgi:hypothetical protein
VGCSSGVQGLTAAERQALAGHGIRPGRAPPSPEPTARKAQLPGGNRMTREANAGSRKAAGNRDAVAGPPPAVPDNWPDTGLVPWTRKGADAGQVSL